MLRMIIADDEPLVRETISKIIDWNQFGIELIGSCRDGIETYNMILDEYPDLVLLDYEMPVCNGGQILEMIRSEKDFSDLPVIFLTCRVDRDSVRRAISLKPEGYLSKFLPAESVKKEFDRFFENDSP